MGELPTVGPTLPPPAPLAHANATAGASLRQRGGTFLVKNVLLNQEYWEPGGGRTTELSSVWVSCLSHQGWWCVGVLVRLLDQQRLWRVGEREGASSVP